MNNKVAALSSIIVIVLALPIITKYFTTRRRRERETFKNYDISKISDLGSQAGKYPSADTNVLLQDTFPITGIYGVSDDTASKIWWHYPIFEVGSYKQITNNIRYPNNPDIGKCTATDVCGALYKDKKGPSNYVKPLPPVNPNSGTRVGYFGTRLK